MKLKMPDEFREIGSAFHQDVHFFYPTIEEMAEMAVAHQNRRELEIIKAFLDKLLSGKYGGDELRSIWRKTGADVVFFNAKGKDADKKPGVVLFLTLMRSAVERRLADKTIEP